MPYGDFVPLIADSDIKWDIIIEERIGRDYDVKGIDIATGLQERNTHG